MKLLITRPVVLAGDGGTRSFVPGLTLEVDAAAAEQILGRKAAIVAEPVAEPVAGPVAGTEAPAAPRRRKPADAQT